MGKLLPSYKKAIIDDIINNISSNTSHYYAFAANPIINSGNTPSVNSDDYSTVFINDWQMLFGKKITNTDIIPIINNIQWTSNSIYTKYDNTSNTLYSNEYYVITSPSIVGGNYDVYKCIDNANGSPSTQKPDQIQPSSFQKSDGYIWRYMTSISSANYDKFSTTQYSPIYPNSSIVASAYNYSGVEVVMITNSGSGYISYNNGTIRSVVNSTLVQIESTASIDNDFYTKNSIYIYNTSSATSQLRNVSRYVSNTSGNWVFLDEAANTTNITPSITNYRISPRVVFETDADSIPVAYSVVNTYSNSISQIVMIDNGYGVSWANVYVVSNTNYGSGCNLYAIVPPPGGHGANPEIELNLQGYCVSFKFANTESNTIVYNTTYNKIGLLKNPYVLQANNIKGSRYSSNTFNEILIANVSPSATFTVGEIVTGNTSGSKGTVVYSNSTVIYLTGDKGFSNNETIISSNGDLSTVININKLGDIYTKDIVPLYIQNISDVTRSNTQTESYKLIIQV